MPTSHGAFSEVQGKTLIQLLFVFRNKDRNATYSPTLMCDNLHLALGGEQVTLKHGKKHKKKREPYEKPTATQLSPEDAEAKLRRLADQGDTQAQEMLQILSRREAPQQDPQGDDRKDKKKSA